MKVVGFDLGETLIYYPNVPLSWKTLYREALMKIQNELGLIISNELLNKAEEILVRYNTRINPREFEVTDTEIFQDIFKEWDNLDTKYLSQAIEIFFSFFQQSSSLYGDTLITLKALKERNVKVGVLTDVPYGMNKEFVLRDIKPIQEYIDVIITSVDVGLRKPSPKGFVHLAKELGIEPKEMIFVGNEIKDIEGANRSGMKSALIDRIGKGVEWNQSILLKDLTEIIDFYV
jgi:putative hydrolase of the HAD superfamily